VVRITGIACGYSHDTTIEVYASWSDYAPVRPRLTFPMWAILRSGCEPGGAWWFYHRARPGIYRSLRVLCSRYWIREPASLCTQLNQLRARKHRGNSK